MDIAQMQRLGSPKLCSLSIIMEKFAMLSFIGFLQDNHLFQIINFQKLDLMSDLRVYIKMFTL